MIYRRLPGFTKPVHPGDTSIQGHYEIRAKSERLNSNRYSKAFARNFNRLGSQEQEVSVRR
jgi:hypothetical protein